MGETPRAVDLTPIADERGSLIVADAGAGLPFQAVRYFLIHDVPTGAVRGRHALREGEELLSCLTGACTVDLRWQGGEATHRLTDPAKALHVPSWVWVECRDFSADAVLLVLCSRHHDPEDQVTDLAEFEAGPPPLR